MSNHWNKVVSGACKPKHAPPKSKYIDALVSSTYQADGSFQDVSRALRSKLRDPNSSIVFKALLVIHTLIRAGNAEEVMTYWSGLDGRDGRSLGLSDVSNTNDTPQNLARYANYLLSRFKCYAALKHDPIRTRSEAPASLRQSSRNGANRLRTLTVEKGLLREVSTLQKLMDSLVECKFYLEDTDDDLVMSALRLLVKDLLVLFQAVNEGVINVLEHYFEMSHVDATTALKTYKIFCKQCEKVVAYLGVAKKLQNIINVNIPNLRHAPVSLAGSLEEYLNDPNFEVNRAEYKESKRIADGKPVASKPVTSQPTPAKAISAPAQPPALAAPEGQKTFTDFFESIESEQQSMFSPNSMSPSANYFQQQSSINPFQPQPNGFSSAQVQPTGFPGIPAQPTGFGGPSQTVEFMNPQSTGYINAQPTGLGRASMGQALFGSLNGSNATSFLQSQPTGFGVPFGSIQPQMTGANPFRQSTLGHMNAPPFGPIAAQPTGYNPFASTQTANFSNSTTSPWQSMPDRANGAMSAPPGQSSEQPASLKPQATGSRNPFAPVPGSLPAVPKLPNNLSLNALAASAFSQSMVQQRAREQAAALQQQQQQSNQSQQKPAETLKDPVLVAEEQRAAEQKAQFANFFSTQLSKLEGGGKMVGAQGQGASGGGLFASVASEFAVTKPKEESLGIGGSSLQTPTSLNAQPTGFGSLNSQPTGFPSLNSQSTGFPSSLDSQPTTSSTFTPSFLSTQPMGMVSGQQPIISQPTGFGGSTVKPFQPSSSFGASLQQNLTSNPFTSGTASTGPSSSFQPQQHQQESLI
ncbi:hypothetical protein CROQUDRAFT_109819 [Cronartium quercuum f. sp. fusiforme G11]|uniref:ENTH domain-containing protein n=1 Tax=Cronartium quercuum f. sp. fusiforme G11 TaxID=708437 RepID=A0A9P6NAP6_9BASI|nr:hypothetical protein CROQUDRAFT_109819 [Cronartium quercuum f. sp. fusiforme G11]